jgi:hypothetical protein
MAHQPESDLSSTGRCGRRRGAFSQRVRELLVTTSHTPREISAMVGCSYELATKIRRESGTASYRQMLTRRVDDLTLAVRDLRERVRHLEGQGPVIPRE